MIDTDQNFTLNSLLQLLQAHKDNLQNHKDRGYNVNENPKIKVVAGRIVLEEYVGDLDDLL